MKKMQVKLVGTKRAIAAFKKRCPEPVKKEIKKEVKKEISRTIEHKYLQQDYAPINPINYVLATASSALLNNFATGQGVGDNSRIGDKVKFKYLDLMFNLKPTALNTNTAVRVLLFRTLAPEGTNYSPADFMTASASMQINRPLLPNLKETNHVYFDKIYHLKSPGNITAEFMPRIVHIKIKLNFITTYYPNSVAGTIADIKTNALYVAFIAETGTGPASFAKVDDCQAILQYEDA